MFGRGVFILVFSESVLTIGRGNYIHVCRLNYQYSLTFGRGMVILVSQKVSLRLGGVTLLYL